MRALSLVDRNQDHCEVVTEAARQLEGRIPKLAVRLIDLILDDCPSYVLVPDEELQSSVERALRVGLATVPRPSSDRLDLEQAEYDGRRRAEQGVLLPDLLRAYQHSVTVVWDGLVEIVSAADPDRLDLLMRSSMHVWTCVNRQADAAAAGYRQAQEEQNQQSDMLSQSILGKLLTAASPEPGLAETVAASLDLDEHGRYAVAVLRHPPGRPLAYPTRIAGMRCVWWLRQSGAVAVIALGSADASDVARSLMLDGQVGIGPAVTGLAALSRGRRLAELALASRPAGGVTLLEDNLLKALTTAVPEVAAVLTHHTLGAVLALEPGERDLLLETVAVWLDCEATTAVAATRLYCHRNTVINRLHRVEKLTGLRLSDPRDLAMLTVALEVLDTRVRRPSLRSNGRDQLV
ncbi:helix-turn-helix domain-containing protein [Actinocorallia longicatena]|uniref:Helix-turn-helix domain-containing protein n=1 Tax=Actinocorallia longicatena TaxID=111803 RepID=A0ABP6Q7E9_9ACTN